MLKKINSKNYVLLGTLSAYFIMITLSIIIILIMRFNYLNSNSVYSSTLEVLDFDIEKQFVNPDWNKLNQLANQTSGKAYLANQADDLVKQLMADESYKAIQKTLVKKSPLIDWIWLLVLIAISLATEWFVRKYNGLL